MTELLNLLRVSGDYNDITPMSMETALTVQMVDLEIRKTADHLYWGSGPLTYTITVSNSETVPYTNIELVDTLEYAKVDFVDGSVEIDGTPVADTDYNYDDQSGELSVAVGTVAADSEVEITFRVTKKIPSP